MIQTISVKRQFLAVFEILRTLPRGSVFFWPVLAAAVTLMRVSEGEFGPPEAFSTKTGGEKP
jgi:hypothetical protein